MSCVAVFCSSRTTKGGVKDPEVSFHTFPKCPEVRNAWIRVIRRENWEPKEYSRICSKHFEPSCFISGLKIKKLKSDAIPTIFEGYPKYYQPVVKKRKITRELSCKEEPDTSETSFTYEEETLAFHNEETLRQRRLLKTIEKIQATSVRRLKKLKCYGKVGEEH